MLPKLVKVKYSYYDYPAMPWDSLLALHSTLKNNPKGLRVADMLQLLSLSEPQIRRGLRFYIKVDVVEKYRFHGVVYYKLKVS